jgi:hypothetical protein
VIVQRSKLDLLAAIAEAVNAEAAKGEMALIRDETKPNADKELPMLYCGEIIDAPYVRAPIARGADLAKSSNSE